MTIRTYDLPTDITNFLRKSDFSLSEFAKRFAEQRGGTASAAYLILCKAKNGNKKFTATTIEQLSRLMKSYTEPGNKNLRVNLTTTVDHVAAENPQKLEKVAAAPLSMDNRVAMTIERLKNLEFVVSKIDAMAANIAKAAEVIEKTQGPDPVEFERKLSEIEGRISELRASMNFGNLAKAS